MNITSHGLQLHLMYWHHAAGLLLLRWIYAYPGDDSSVRNTCVMLASPSAPPPRYHHTHTHARAHAHTVFETPAPPPAHTNTHTQSLPAGVCDDVKGLCYCDGPKHGRLPALADSPPGTLPIRVGRPLSEYCQPAEVRVYNSPNLVLPEAAAACMSRAPQGVQTEGHVGRWRPEDVLPSRLLPIVNIGAGGWHCCMLLPPLQCYVAGMLGAV